MTRGFSLNFSSLNIAGVHTSSWKGLVQSDSQMSLHLSKRESPSLSPFFANGTFSRLLFPSSSPRKRKVVLNSPFPLAFLSLFPTLLAFSRYRLFRFIAPPNDDFDNADSPRQEDTKRGRLSSDCKGQARFSEAIFETVS